MILLEKAIRFFIQQNTAFRLQLVRVNGEVRQYINPNIPESLQVFNVQTSGDTKQALEQWAQQEFITPFQLWDAPLFKFVLLHIDEHTCGYFIKIHHIIADGWSIQLMTDQISAAYELFLSGRALAMPLMPGYEQYIAIEQEYLSSERFYKDQLFWQQAFQEQSQTYLIQSTSDLDATRSTFTIDTHRTHQLQQLARSQKWSLNALFTAMTLVYFHKLLGEDDITIGIPVFNRRGAKEKNFVGMFTSTMPFRKKIRPTQPIEELVQEVSRELMRCLHHQRYPYDLLIKNLGMTQERADQLFQVCMNYYNTKPARSIAGLTVENTEWFCGKQLYSLQIIVKDWADQGTLEYIIDYKKKDYTETQIKHFYAWIQYSIDTLLKQKQTIIRDVEICLEDEKRLFLYDNNDTSTPYPDASAIQQLFEWQVVQSPAAIALIDGPTTVTYEMLHRRSNQFAHMLRMRSVEKGQVVALAAQHSIELIIAIWGIIKAGGIYLPIDPTNPADRYAYILSDSQASLFITDQPLPPSLHFTGSIIYLQERQYLQEENSDIAIVNHAHDPLYIIYTSGSTGQPKGTLVEHRSLVNYVWWAKKAYLTTTKECFAFYSSIAFDLTLTSLFVPLISGNSIAIYRENSDEFILHRILRENICTIIKATPSHLTLLDKEMPSSSQMRCFIVGGEDFHTTLAFAIWQKWRGRIRLFNEYGPTEATIGCMIHEYDPEQDRERSVPIGRPIDNMQVYLLTRQLQLAPMDSVAEIYIAGDGLSRGYIQQENLTRERFIDNPFTLHTCMYRTGDLARYHNGVIEYLGRVDDQVKIHGYRIELPEIESALLAHEAVGQAVAVVRQDSAGQQHLISFVRLEAALSMLELKLFLAQRLPTFMIPSLLVECTLFPLSSNGKIDRSALAEMPLDTSSDQSFPVDTEIARHVIQVFTEILSVPGITLDSNIAFMGSDSIKAIQIAARLNSLGYQVHTRDIMTYPIVKELVVVLASNRPTSRITHSQEVCAGLIDKLPIVEWFKRSSDTQPDYWHQAIVLELHAHLSINEIKAALHALMQHHDTLRINYSREAAEMYYNPAYLEDDTRILEVIDAPDGDLADTLRIYGSRLKQSIHLEQGPLFRALLIRTNKCADRLLLVTHHIIIDGVSWRILLDDLSLALSCLRQEQPIHLPAKMTSLQKWASALKRYAESINEEELAFWQRINGEQSCLPYDYDGVVTDSSRSRETIICELSANETQLLTTDANRMYGTQANDLLLAALIFAIADSTQLKEIVFEVETHGREPLFEDMDVSRTIGWFTTLFPARFSLQDVSPQTNLVSIIEQFHHIPQKGIGFGILAYLANKIDVPSHSGIRFNYLGSIDSGLDNEFFSLVREDSGPDMHDTNQLTCDIDVQALIYQGTLYVEFHYHAHRYQTSTIQALADTFLQQLRAIIADCCGYPYEDPLLNSSSLLSQEELDLLLED